MPVQVVDVPILDTEISSAQARSIRAVAGGEASGDEQKIAIAAIMHICGVNDLEFLPDEHGGERDSAFKSGKRFVGLQLRKLTNVDLNLIIGEKDG